MLEKLARFHPSACSEALHGDPEHHPDKQRPPLVKRQSGLTPTSGLMTTSIGRLTLPQATLTTSKLSLAAITAPTPATHSRAPPRLFGLATHPRGLVRPTSGGAEHPRSVQSRSNLPHASGPPLTSPTTFSLLTVIRLLTTDTLLFARCPVHARSALPSATARHYILLPCTHPRCPRPHHLPFDRRVGVTNIDLKGNG